MEETYYYIPLTDHALPAFCSGPKGYCGTEADMAGLTAALAARDPAAYGKLLAAFDRFRGGDAGAEHPVGFGPAVRLMQPMEVLARETVTWTAMRWLHRNIWDCHCPMRCRQVTTHHLWLGDGERWVRCVRPVFTGLEMRELLGDWEPVTGDWAFWGHPDMLYGQGDMLTSRLYQPERFFETEAAQRQDHGAFQKAPQPVLTEFCNDIFGDG